MVFLGSTGTILPNIERVRVRHIERALIKVFIFLFLPIALQIYLTSLFLYASLSDIYNSCLSL